MRFFSHLTVLADFTNDRAVLDAALRLGLGSSRDADVRVSPYPSLAANLDFAEARKAAHVERALELVAAALAPIPGAKAVIFAGWGFFANRAPIEGDLYERALGALMRARANVFMLDTSDADWHTLETTLQTASEVTGGTYAKTHIFAGQAVERVARALAGRWVIVCVAPDAAPRTLDVALAGPARRRRRAGVHCAAMMRSRAAARAALAAGRRHRPVLRLRLRPVASASPSASASGLRAAARRKKRIVLVETKGPGPEMDRFVPRLLSAASDRGPRRHRGRAPLRRPPRGRRGAGRGLGRVPPRLPGRRLHRRPHVSVRREPPRGALLRPPDEHLGGVPQRVETVVVHYDADCAVVVTLVGEAGAAAKTFEVTGRNGTAEVSASDTEAEAQAAEDAADRAAKKLASTLR